MPRLEPLEVQVKIADMAAFREFVERVKDFISEYAWHTRDCVAIDGDGQWHVGNKPCSCGYDETLERLVD
jgi:hypothetical protein